MIKDVDGDTNDIEANKADDDDGTYDVDGEANTGSVSHSHMHTPLSAFSLSPFLKSSFMLTMTFDMVNHYDDAQRLTCNKSDHVT